MLTTFFSTTWPEAVADLNQPLLLICICSALSEGTILDNHQLICLYMLSQLLERELDKCLRLVAAIPMDMSGFYGEKNHMIPS